MLTWRKEQPVWPFRNATGTESGSRRRGIPTALKLSGLAYARERDYSDILTTNSSRLPGILALNQRLGFRPYGGCITLERERDRWSGGG